MSVLQPTFKAVVSLLLVLVIQPVWAQGYQVTTLAGDLELPWSIAQLPGDEGFLVTEKPGRLNLLSLEGDVTPVSGVPEVFFESQGGLLEVLIDPDFSTNRTVYLSYAGGDRDANRTTVARAILEDFRLLDLTVILEVTPAKAKAAHFGGKLAFAADGSLLVTVGEGFEYREEAQNLTSELGTILRINSDGSVPDDNPFGERAPRTLSYGHRNPQGLAVDPIDGTVWMTEHGPRGGDELNRVTAGANYGWPAITYGVDYSGALVSPYTQAEGMEQPVVHWVPSIGTSGLTVYRGQAFPEFDGSLLLGALVDERLYRLAPEGSGFVQSEPFPEVTGRIRDVRVLGDGSIVAVADEGLIYHITPDRTDAE